ncbi:MAG TPA: hypothetical protein VFQ81_06960 [Candidatus Limnocylindria bacterium]|nr:hypothetical protein [Candidatus Limnocylindria bacterium]
MELLAVMILLVALIVDRSVARRSAVTVPTRTAKIRDPRFRP